MLDCVGDGARFVVADSVQDLGRQWHPAFSRLARANSNHGRGRHIPPTNAAIFARKHHYRGAYPIPDKLQTRTMRTTMVNATYSLSRSTANAITENATLAIGVAISNNNPN